MSSSSTSFELSPLYRHTSSQFAFFPRELPYLVTCHLDRLILRHTETLAIQQTWQLPIGPPPPKSAPAPSHKAQAATQSTSASNAKLPPPESLLTSLEVSKAAPYRILAFSAKAGMGWIIDRDYEQPVAKIEVGAEGALAMAWSGAGDTILVWSASHLRLSLYRLENPTPALHINSPKLNHPHGYSFRPTDHAFLALAERHNGRDHIGVYDSKSWKLLRHFALPSPTADIADLAWSPCGRYIAVWENLTEYLLHIYNPDGRLLSTFAPYAHISPATTTDPSSKPGNSKATTAAESGKKEASSVIERAREERSTEGWVGLGIRSVGWHPTGDWIAVGGWDGKIRILTRLSWAPVAELLHPSRIASPALAYREPVEWIERTRGRGIVPFEPCSLPHQSLPLRPDLSRPNPRMGVSELGWSPSGRYLGSYHAGYPSQIFIFALQTMGGAFRPRLHSVVQLNGAVRGWEWMPERGGEDDALVVVSGTKSFAMWTEPASDEEGPKVEGVGIPAHAPFGPHALRFDPAGDALFLQDRETFALAYPVREGEGAEVDAGEGGRTWMGSDE